MATDVTNTPALGSNIILSLREDSRGALWIGTRGAGLTRRLDGQFQTFTTADGLPSNFVNDLIEDRDRTLWIATEGGLARFDGSRFVKLGAAEGFTSDSFANAVVQDRRGVVWVGTSSSGLYAYENGRFSKRLDAAKVGAVLSLAEDRDGVLWVGTSTGLYGLAASHIRTFTRGNGLPNDRVNALLEDADRNLWIATGRGVARLTGGALTVWTEEEGLSNNSVQSLFEDAEHSIWIGTDGGLDRLRDSKFVAYARPQGLDTEFVWAALPDRHTGALWLATQDGLFQLAGGHVRPVAQSSFSGADIHALYQDVDGSIWAGMLEGGVGHLVDGTVTIYTLRDGLGSNSVESIYRDREGRLWVGTRAGLSRQEGRRFVTVANDGAAGGNRVRTLLQDRRGTLWIGTFGGGLCRLVDDRFACLGIRDGLASDRIVALREDADGGIWIGTHGGGVSRLVNGRIRTYTTREGMFDNTIHTTIEDDLGFVWFSCNKGIFRIPRRAFDELDRGAIPRLHADVYQRADGTLSAEANSGTPASARTADGRLWFATVRGVAAIDPAHIATNDRMPPVVIESVIADGRVLPGDGAIELQAGSKHLQIDYTALSFRNPERVAFKYRLEGYDRDWVAAGSRRTAYYTNLSPGTFRFHVIAANDDGMWNERGASVSIALRPRFYQTLWFGGLLGILVVWAAAAGHGVRVRAVERAQTARRIREQDERFRALVEHSTDGVALVTGDRRLLYLSPASARIIGHQPEALIGASIVDLIHDDDRADFETFLGAVVASDVVRGVFRFKHADGSWRFIEVSAVDRAGDAAVGALVINYRDVSEERRAAQELAAARDAAERASLAKSEFVANMSHEIRTPMNGILGMTNLALESSAPEEQRQYMTLVKESGEWLLTIINDILDFSKIEAGRLELHPKPIDIREEIGGTLKPFAYEAKQRGLKLIWRADPDLPARLEADPARVRQVVVNLVGNAMKFTQKGEIEVRARINDEGALWISVRDTGIGIAPEKHRAIFEQFTQADGTTSRRYGGTGLGLTISARLAALMNGRIWVESTPGAGSTFHFTARLKVVERSAAPSDEASRAAAAPPASLRILLAEDNPVNQLLAVRLLERAGHVVHLAGNGRLAVDLWQRNTYDVVLMDVQMPELDGFEATRAIREAEAQSGRGRIPIVAMTAHALSGDRDRCLAAGMDGYVSKPISPDALMAELTRVCAARAHQDVYSAGL